MKRVMWMKERGREGKGWIDFTCAAVVHAMEPVWHKFKGLDTVGYMRCSNGPKKDMVAFEDNTPNFQPLQTPLPKGFHTFIIVKPTNHMNSNQCDRWQPTHTVQPQLEDGFTMMRKCGSKKVLFCNNRVCDCRGRSYAGTKKTAKWWVYNDAIKLPLLKVSS